MADGRIEFDTKLDTSDFDNASNDISKKAKKTADSVSKETEKAAGKSKTAVSTTAEEVKKILDDANRTMKSKAASIGAIYKKQGMSASEAMKKAWEEIERTPGTVAEYSDGSFFEPVSPNVPKSINDTSFSISNIISLLSGPEMAAAAGAIAAISSSLIGLAKVSKTASKGIVYSIETVFGIRGIIASSKLMLNGLKLAMDEVFDPRRIISFAKSAVEASAKLNAENSQLSQTFGELQDNAERAMSRVANASGIVESRLKGVGTSIYAFAKTSGMDSVTALNMMEEALTVAADSAAYYDRSLEETSETLKSFLKGNYANDAALGLSVTETTRNASANKLYGKSFMELSEAQKQLTLLQMVKDANALSGALGQASRESEGWENVLGNLKETWQQLIAVIGQPMLRIATEAVQRMTAALAALTEKARMAVNAVMSLFGWEAENTAEISTNIGTGVENQNALTEAVKDTAEAQEGSLAGFDKITTISSGNKSENTQSSGSTSIVPAVSPIITPVIDTSKADESIHKLKEKLLVLIEPIKLAWEDTSPEFTENIQNTVTNVKGLISSIGNSFAEVWADGAGREAVGNIIGLFGEMLGIIGDISAALKTAWDDDGNGTDFVESLIGRWSSLIALFKRLAADFRAVWNNGTGEKICKTLLKIITNINNTVRKLRDRFREAWEENDVGQSIIQGVLDLLQSFLSMVEDITDACVEWASEVDFGPLLESLDRFLTAFAPVFEAWCDGIAELFKNVILPNLTKFIEEKLPIIIDLLTVMLTNFNNVGTAVGEIITFIENLFTNIGESLQSFGESWVTFWSDVGAAIYDFKNSVLAGFEEIKSFLSEKWNEIQETFSNVGAWFKERFQAAKDNICNVWKTVSGWFADIWNGIKETFSAVGNWFKERFQSAWDNIVGIWTSVTGWFSDVWDGIKEIFAGVGAWFEERFQSAWDNIAAVFANPAEFFDGVWSAITGCFSSVTTWFRDTFSEAWQAVKDVFSSGGEIFTGITDGIAETFKSVVNSLIDGINWVICEPFDAINSALDSLRNFDIGGMNPFGWLPWIEIPQIPYLAQGTVVPANYGNFLAMLGDNKRETEIVSPLSTIERAVANALNKHEEDTPQEIALTVYLYPNSQYFHREVIKIINDDARNRGE